MIQKNGRGITKLLFSPIFLYLVIWLFILFVFSLKIVVFPKLSPGFYLVLTMNFLGLLLGTVQSKLMHKKSPTERDQILFETEKFFTWIRSNKYVIKKVYTVLCVLGSLGVLFMYMKVFTQISISGYFHSEQYVKSNLVRSLFGTYLSMCAYIALPLSACLDWVGKNRLKYSRIPLCMAALYSFSYWGRFPILMAVLIMVVSKLSLFLLNKQLKDFLEYKRGTILRAGVIAAASFIVIFLFMSWTIELRVEQYGNAYNPYATHYQDNMITKVIKPVASLFGSFRAITLTYSYFVASIPTLSYWASRPSEYGMGQASFPYLYRLLDKIGLIHEPLIVGDQVVGLGMQLPSFVGYLYIDFGWIGVLVVSYILGIVSTSTYEKFLRKPSMLLLMNLSLIYALIIFSPMTNVLSQTMFLIILVGFIVVNRILKKNTMRCVGMDSI